MRIREMMKRRSFLKMVGVAALGGIAGVPSVAKAVPVVPMGVDMACPGGGNSLYIIEWSTRQFHTGLSYPDLWFKAVEPIAPRTINVPKGSKYMQIKISEPGYEQVREEMAEMLKPKWGGVE